MSARSPLLRRVALLGILITLCACSGGGSSKQSAGAKTTSTARAGSRLELKLQPTQVANAGDKNATLDDGTRDKVLAAVRAYLDNGLMKPLASGSKAGDLSSAFAAGALARATGPDAATVFDGGLPKVSGLEAKTATVTLTDLAGGDGAPLMVGAGLVVDLEGTASGKPVHIHRLADFALAPDNGVWKIAGYDVAVQRDGAGVPVAAAGSTASTTAGATTSGSKP